MKRGNIAVSGFAKPKPREEGGERYEKSSEKYLGAWGEEGAGCGVSREGDLQIGTGDKALLLRK